jgi:hypothetical protein
VPRGNPKAYTKGAVPKKKSPKPKSRKGGGYRGRR